jgi:hypothetical protein
MADEIGQINVRIHKKLTVALRKSVKARAKAESTKFNMTDFMIEAAKAHIKRWGDGRSK